MIIEILENSLNIVGDKPIEFNPPPRHAELVSASNTNSHKNKFPKQVQDDGKNLQPNQPLFETIKIENGKAYNLEYHQERVDRSYKEYYKTASKLKLKEQLVNLPQNGLYRAKLIYDKNGLISLDYYIYSKKTIKKLALVEIENIEYHYKYLNRDIFNSLPKIADDIIITKNGYLTDSTIANIALLDKNLNIWHTPQEPLFVGTTLKRYIEKKLTFKNIHFSELKNYQKIATLNAMVDFNII